MSGQSFERLLASVSAPVVSRRSPEPAWCSMLAIASFLVLGVAAECLADSVTLSAPVQDSSIFSEDDALSGGAEAELYAGTTAGGDERRLLLKFNVSAIPAGVSITNVELKLFATNLGASSAQFGLRRVTAAWGEGPSVGGGADGSLAEPNDATWRFRQFDSQPWSVAGGDVSATASAVTNVGTAGSTTYTWSGIGLVQDVAGWIEAPGTNHGWMLKSETGTGALRRFGARENPLAAARPVLVVTYTPAPTRVPVPPFALLGLAALLGGLGGHMVMRRQAPISEFGQF